MISTAAPLPGGAADSSAQETRQALYKETAHRLIPR